MICNYSFYDRPRRKELEKVNKIFLKKSPILKKRLAGELYIREQLDNNIFKFSRLL